MVKRVIGLPGEEIVIDFGEVLIDGQRGLDRWAGGHGALPGTFHGTFPGTGTFPEGRWQIGSAETFVLSDNRPATVDDGRSFGPIPTAGMFVLMWPRPTTQA